MGQPALLKEGSIWLLVGLCQPPSLDQSCLGNKALAKSLRAEFISLPQRTFVHLRKTSKRGSASSARTSGQTCHQLSVRPTLYFGNVTVVLGHEQLAYNRSGMCLQPPSLVPSPGPARRFLCWTPVHRAHPHAFLLALLSPSRPSLLYQ